MDVGKDPVRDFEATGACAWGAGGAAWVENWDRPESSSPALEAGTGETGAQGGEKDRL